MKKLFLILILAFPLLGKFSANQSSCTNSYLNSNLVKLSIYFFSLRVDEEKHNLLSHHFRSRSPIPAESDPPSIKRNSFKSQNIENTPTPIHAILFFITCLTIEHPSQIDCVDRLIVTDNTHFLP